MSSKLWRVLWLASCWAGCSNSVAIFEHDAADAQMQPDGALAELDAGAEAEIGEDDASDAPDAEPLPPDRVSAAAAFGQTCVINGQGLYCWGRNQQNQLGLGTAPAPGLSPARVNDRAYTHVCTGEEHSCALTVSKHVECWGANRFGQLGLGDDQPRATPTQLPDTFTARTITCGAFSTCAIDDAGAALCWGRNDEGQTGQADPYGSPHVQSPKPIALSGPFQAVAAGQGHACALRESGELFCWGRNTSGQLGIGNEQIQVRPPTAVTPSSRYRAIATAMSHSCAIRQDGRLFCWGNNLDGLLGAGSDTVRHYLPVQVGDAADHDDVQLNWFHTCTLREGGRLFCWGRNVEGQLGLGDTEPRSRPEALPDTGWNKLAIGQFHSCAIRDSSLYCWGKNEEGELGLGAAGRKSTPARVWLQ